MLSVLKRGLMYYVCLPIPVGMVISPCWHLYRDLENRCSIEHMKMGRDRQSLDQRTGLYAKMYCHTANSQEDQHAASGKHQVAMFMRSAQRRIGEVEVGYSEKLDGRPANSIGGFAILPSHLGPLTASR
nr:hypothetical protein CFP56_09236 [Quercus suber]